MKALRSEAGVTSTGILLAIVLLVVVIALGVTIHPLFLLLIVAVLLVAALA